MKCKHNIDGYCVSSDSPYRADCCPCYEEDDICKFKDDSFSQQTAQIEHLTAEVAGLKRFIRDLMKDEEIHNA